MADNKVVVAKQSDIIQMSNFDFNRKLAELTPEEKAQVTALAVKINPQDMGSVRVYGSELSTVISHNGDELLQSVRADKTNEVVALSTDLLKQLNMLDIDKIAGNGLWARLRRRFPILNKLSKRVQNIFAEYDTIKGNVETISKKISASKMVALADNSSLQKIFDNNLIYIDQMKDLILGAKLRQQELQAEYDRMQQDPTVETWQLNDMSNFINAVDKRVADMLSEVYILDQNLYQIRAIQCNNMSIADKADNICTNIIPLWSSQLAIAVTMQNQKENVEAQMKITEATNIMLRKNAENLKINSINVAKESERAMIDLETLQKTTNDLMDTIREVQAIHAQGAQERKNFEVAIEGYANQLHEMLLTA